VPFRSEAEPLREQIRRLEEQAQELRDERAALERQRADQEIARAGSRRWLLVLAGSLAIGATGFVGFMAGDIAAGKRALHLRELSERQQADELDDAVQAKRDCDRRNDARQSELAVCGRDRASARWQSTAPLFPRQMR
jgi:hypothetical protein